jgi:DNA-binding response OmpR family regulator
MRPTALVVDDDPVMLAQMSAAFHAAGFRTLSAENGRIGVQLARAAAPDVVATDILMPEQEGVATILQLKALPRPPQIIAISGGGRLASGVVLDWACHLGADAALPKPFAMSKLVELAKRLLPGPVANAPPPTADQPKEFVERELCVS